MTYSTWLILGIAIITTSCVHYPRKGTVVMKYDNDRAHVCLGNEEVGPGDRLDLYEISCVGSTRPGTNDPTLLTECTRDWLGKAVVIKTLNDHYSTIKVDPGVAFNEGTLVETVRR